MTDLYDACGRDESFLCFMSKYEPLFTLFNQHRITTAEILITSPAVLASHLSNASSLPALSLLVDDFYLDLVRVLSHRTAYTADKLSSVSTESLITTGSVGLDKYLNGGIPTSYLTEVAGESASGKSNFLIQLLLMVQLPPLYGGLSKKAIYISTESGLETRRLYETLNTIQSHDKYPSDISAQLSPDNIHVVKCFELEELSHVVSYQLPRALEREDIGLVAIDSIAPQFRTNYTFSRTDQASSYNTSALVFQLAKQLKALARKHNVAIVVANQTSDRFDRSVGLPSSHHRIPPMLMDHQVRWFTGWNQSSLSKYTFEGDLDDNPSAASQYHAVNSTEHSSSFPFASQVSSSQVPPRSASALQGIPPLFSRGTPRDVCSVSSHQSQIYSSTKKIPVLGLLWGNAVDQRIVLKRFSVMARDMENLKYQPSLARKLVLVFSDRADSNMGGQSLSLVDSDAGDAGSVKAGIEFEIKDEGLVAIEDNIRKPKVEYGTVDDIFYNEKPSKNHEFLDVTDSLGGDSVGDDDSLRGNVFITGEISVSEDDLIIGDDLAYADNFVVGIADGVNGETRFADDGGHISFQDKNPNHKHDSASNDNGNILK